MALSTFLTLFVIPVVYVLMSRLQSRIKREGRSMLHGNGRNGSGKPWWHLRRRPAPAGIEPK
jgi:hypothetical protein